MTTKEQQRDVVGEEPSPFTEDPEIADLVLDVQGQKFYVCKAILAVASPVFRKMFTSDFKEKHSGELELPGKDAKSILEFLKCIYPNIMKPIDGSTIHHVLPLLHEYDCKVQLQNCQSFMKEYVTNIDNQTVSFGRYEYDMKVLQYLLWSDRYNCQTSLKACIEAVKNVRLGFRTEEVRRLLNELSSEVREKILFERVQMLEDKMCRTCKDKLSKYVFLKFE